VKDVHFKLEIGLLIDNSIALAMVCVKCSVRMKPSSEVFFAWIMADTYRLCVPALIRHDLTTAKYNA